MDSKKTSSYSKGRPKLHVPQRGSQEPNRRTAVAPKTASATDPPASDMVTTDTTRKAKKKRSNRPVRLTKKRMAILAVLIVIAVLAISQLTRQNEQTQKPGAITASSDPEYQTVLPGEKSISELGGWKRVSPEKNDPVYAYLDTIDDVSVSVSQQKLPASFKGDVDTQTAELAKKFNATTKISAGNTFIYVGTSAKGPQSAIVAKNDLLILIKSQSKVEDASWAEYAKSLN